MAFTEFDLNIPSSSISPVPTPATTTAAAVEFSPRKIPTTLPQTQNGVVHEVLNCVIPYIHDSRDRHAVSEVCRLWCELDKLTRKHVTIHLCYSTTPEQLRRRFPFLESLKLKGMPRAAMFDQIPQDWGGYATPWVTHFSIPHHFQSLKSIYFRRMIVNDSDLQLLAHSRAHQIQSLKLTHCSGFSTHGLRFIGRSCRNLRVLVLEDSSQIQDIDGEWLHELASNNTVLEVLDFSMTDINKVRVEDLELLAQSCPNLLTLKISHLLQLDLQNVFRYSTTLEEFWGSSYLGMPLPERLCRLGLPEIENEVLPCVFPCAASLKKLDLIYAVLDTDGLCAILRRCPKLEVLKVGSDAIGDRGLQVIGRCCRRLKKLRIERGADVVSDVSHIGLIPLSQGCTELEYLAIYVSGITNEALEQIGTHLKNLSDFRLGLLKHVNTTDFPLDNGVRALLMGCEKLKRFALWMWKQRGGLTDLGLSYIGQYSQNVRWMLLGSVGESDEGLKRFSNGCPNLQKLEVVECPYFSERALAIAAKRLSSLRYLWVEVEPYYPSTPSEPDLLTMARPFWNMELTSSRTDYTCYSPQISILGYYSLAGQRSDFPATVRPLAP